MKYIKQLLVIKMSARSYLLKQEQIIFPLSCTSFIIVTLSGFITYFYPINSIWQQLTYLVHLFVGIVLTFSLSVFIFYHFRRALSTRRSGSSALGILTALSFFVVALTGLHIAIVGQLEFMRWVIDFHIFFSIALIILIILHIALHIFVLKKENKPNTPVFPSINTQHLNKSLLYGSLGCISLIVLLSFIYTNIPSLYSSSSVIKPYQLTYGNSPFSPSETKTSSETFVDEKLIGNSNHCGTCHEEITRQWEQSIHAQAASDPSYQRNIELLAEKKGMAATRYCEGCHAPVPLLSGVLSEGGTLQTHGHMYEGVSCMGCHGIDSIEHTKGVGSYKFRPAEEYLFANRENLFLKKIHNLLIQIQPRLHRQEMARPALSKPEMCATCHTQFMDKNINQWGWVKMMDEYSAWLKSPFSNQSEQTFSHGKNTRCQDCHFPLEKGSDPSANHAGEIISHRSLGANTAIPYVTNNIEQLELTKQFLQQSKVRLSIEIPNRKQALRSSKPIDPSLVELKETPGYFYLNEELSFSIISSNLMVGHDFPGGSTDINEVWIHVIARDSSNRLIFESGGLDNKLFVDPEAHFYRSIPIDRHGKAVWRHDLFNMIGDSYKKTIPSGQSDIVKYQFKIPSWVKPPVIINATLKYRKFNQRYAEWVFKTPGISLPIVNMATQSISIPIRIRPEATSVNNRLN